MREFFGRAGNVRASTDLATARGTIEEEQLVRLFHFRHESRVTSLPTWVENLNLPRLSALAKLFGVGAYDARWDSLNPDAEPKLRAGAQT